MLILPEGLAEFQGYLLVQELRLKHLCVLTPSQHPSLDLVGPSDLGREEDGTVLLGLDLLGVVPSETGQCLTQRPNATYWGWIVPRRDCTNDDM